MQDQLSTDQDALTLKEAAALAGRSYAWAWDRAADGRLETHKKGNRIFVSGASLRREIQRARLEMERRTRGRKSSRPHLRLVVDNTK